MSAFKMKIRRKQNPPCFLLLKVNFSCGIKLIMCYHCGYTYKDNEKIFRLTVCPECGRDAHVCLNCTFYAPGKQHDCRETIDTAVREKDKANFCDYFVLDRAKKSKSPDNKSNTARNDFKALFDDE